MNVAVKIEQAGFERPGWIPPDVGDNWDDDPYAYQTEEEAMPAGGLHNQLLAYIMEVLRGVLATRGLMFLMDPFLLYRDKQGIKQRIAPDLLLLPLGYPPPHSYDLDVLPPPRCIIEMTSPKSRLRDLRDKRHFYFGLGITTYLVIDAVTPASKLRDKIEFYLWQNVEGAICSISPDKTGYFLLPEMQIKITAIDNQLVFIDAMTEQKLLDIEQFDVYSQKLSQKNASLVTTNQQLVQQNALLEAEIDRLKTLLATQNQTKA